MAINSRGAKFLYDSGDTDGLTALEEVRSIRGPSGTAGQIDTTHLGSTGKEYLPDLPDGGEVTLSCNFVAGAVQMEMFDAFQASADARPCEIRIPQSAGATTYHHLAFNGVVTRWETGEAVGSQVTLDITVKVSGAVSYSAT